jgi:small subunit ribosomal protein S4e
MLDKLGGVFAPRPSTGPHKLRECLPLVVFLRNRLKYALTYDEVKKIVNQRLVKVDGKVRTDKTYPAGFMGKKYDAVNCSMRNFQHSFSVVEGKFSCVVDVITIEKTAENFRLIYDVKGRFTVHRISNEEAKVFYM